jgi:ABC-type branched-subunit amino acid transport system substrate-binding protein
MIELDTGMLRSTVMLLVASLLAGSAGALELTELEAVGKRLYRDGIRPSGSSVTARIGAQSVPVSGTAVPCASCHGADGKGRPEGALRPPEITWRELAKPYGHRHQSGRAHSVFDSAAFTQAVTEGLDPAGQRLDPGMPRYALARSEVDALIAYLKRIDEDHDPGLTASAIRLGTLLPRSGPLAEAGNMVEKILRGAFEQVNAAGGVHGRKLELVVVDAAVEVDLWQRIAAADLFALVSPLAPALADGLHALAESMGLPVVGGLAGEVGYGSHYSFQLTAGEREQGRVLAEFAALRLGLDKPEVAVVVPEADRVLAAVIEGQLARHNGMHVSRRQPGQPLAAAVAGWKERQVDVVFFFGGRDDFAALQRAAADAGWQPAFLTTAVHAGAAGKSRIYVAAPVLPSDGTAAGHRALEELNLKLGLPPRQQALQITAYAAATIAIEGLKRSGHGASRARLVDALENLYAYDTGVTQPISFGPGRRIGVMGGHVMAVDAASGYLRPVGGFIKLE